MRLHTLFAALALSIIAAAATWAAQPVSPVVRPIEKLTALERAQLPDSTRVEFGKRVTTLGALRAAHLRIEKHMRAIPEAQARGEAIAVKLGRLLPPGKALVEPESAYKQGAADMKAFCKAAKATICLYIPRDSGDFVYDNWPPPWSAYVSDPMITDPSVCAAWNGLFQQGACIYRYMTTYTAQFKTAPGKPFSSRTEGCGSFNVATDQHGAASAQWIPEQGEGADAGPGYPPDTCLVYVVLPQ